MNRELLYRGSFYPNTNIEIDSFIQKNMCDDILIKGLKGLVVPHAGWVYSGKTALKGFSNRPDQEIKNIYLIGPSHRFSFKGAALSRFKSYETISSQFILNKEIEQELLNIEDVNIVDDAHIHEHSLEVELEFLKYYYPKALLIPIVAGRESVEPVYEILKKSLNQENSLTIITSDLSHYKPYRIAKKLDNDSINKIITGSEDLGYEDACGSSILNALIKLNNKKDFIINLIDYKNSGDTAGDKTSVVGYCSLGIIKNG